MMKKTFSMLLAGAMLASALAGCGNSDAGEQGGADPAQNADNGSTASAAAFKVGGTGPLSGGNAIYGNAAKNGAQIAVDEINAEGGAVQFELKYEDDESDPAKAENAYNALKDWGMQLSLGAVTSTPGAATNVLHNEDRIFALTPSASSPDVTAGVDNVYQMCFADPNQGTASAQYISDQKLGTKIAVIYRNDDNYSQGVYNTFKTKADELGLEIVSTTTFTDSSATDFSVQIGEAKAAGADLLFLPIYYQPASLILKQSSDIGYAPKVFGIDGMDGILTLEGFDTALAEGVMLLTPFNADADDARTKKFVETYKTQFGDVPNQFAADGYDCIYAYKAALESAGATPDMSAQDLCEKMVETFSTISFDGLTGEGVTWDETGAVSKSPKGMVIKDGAYVGM